MPVIEKSLLRLAFISWAVFAWLLAAEAGLVSRFHVEGLFFRWQLWLLAGIFLVAAREKLADLRCRCCGNHEDLTLFGLLHSGEWLCWRCLKWNPGEEPAAEGEYAELFKALKN